MNITVSNQLFIFASCLVCGVIIGLIFDVFRIVRRLVRTSIFATIIEDIIYWIIAAVVFFLFVLGVNSVELRLYQFIGAFLGMALYFLTVSKQIINVSVCIVQFMAKVLAAVFKVIFAPILFIFRLLRKPLFLVVNIGKKSGWKIKHRFNTSMSNFNKFRKKI